MVTLAPLIRQSFTDANGAPLAGGMLYTYLGGSTTPHVTFTDYTGTTANTNPIILDANGECDVWLAPGSFKFTLTDSTGVQIWSRDHIVISPPSTGGGTGSAYIGVPTDGIIGGPGGGASGTAGSVSGADVTDLIADGFDKVEVVLEKLAPAKPPALSVTPLTISGAYTALASGTGASDYCIDSAAPVIQASGAFGDGATGTLSALLDAVPKGSITLSSANDTGSNSLLQITTDVDYYLGVAGKANFWYVLTAQINAVSLAVGAHTASMTHSTTGTRSLSFAVDDPVTPTTNPSFKTITGSGTQRFVSGVPALTTGGTITAAFSIFNAIKSHYNATRIASASAPETNALNAPLPGTAPANGATFLASIALTVAANKYNENVTINILGYNSKGTTVADTITAFAGNMRIDSLSSETGRVVSGTGQFPTKGTGAGLYGATWDSTAVLSANKEAQMLGGLYRYPPAVNYSTNLPTNGADYSALTADTFNSCRWVTVKLLTISSASSYTFTINGGVNLGSTTLISGLYMYLIVDGATGWIDANAAYPGTGSPSTNGDPGLDIANSTITSRKITFGPTARSGDVYVRIGIPSGSTKQFSGVS